MGCSACTHLCGQPPRAGFERVHGRVPRVELGVAQLGVVRQRPLAPAVVIRVLVALAGEVNPLGVAELVAHKVEPRFSAQDVRREGKGRKGAKLE